MDVMSWMLLPSVKVHVFRVIGRINSKYTDFLAQNAKPILNALYQGKNYFQQDNARIHTPAESMRWLNSNFPNVLEWPSRSPDLNPMENVWKMLSDGVYDGNKFNDCDGLWEKVKSVTKKLNNERSETLTLLVSTINKWLVKVIEKSGGIIN